MEESGGTLTDRFIRVLRVVAGPLVKRTVSEKHACQPSRFNHNCPDFLVSKPKKSGHSDLQEENK